MFVAAPTALVAVGGHDLAQVPDAVRDVIEPESADVELVSLEDAPVTVFCSTRRCYRSFGGGMERGATLLDWGVIIPPDSWVPHIVELTATRSPSATACWIS